jgi:hypothetical protein
VAPPGRIKENHLNRKANVPIVVLAVALLAALLYGIYRYAQPAPILHPGVEDIPPKTASDSLPVKPPPDAGPMPGSMSR